MNRDTLHSATPAPALRTAQWAGSPTIHALPEDDSTTTRCGRNATWVWIGEGIHAIERPVTCRTCVRALTANPWPIIEIDRHRVSYYAPADHSQCAHTAVPTPDHDEACDSVGGRSLDGDRREITPATTTTAQFDPTTMVEAGHDIVEYTRRTLADHYMQYLTWAGPQDATQAPRSAWLSADDNSDNEIFDEITVRIFGVTQVQRAVIFRALTR